MLLPSGRNCNFFHPSTSCGEQRCLGGGRYTKTVASRLEDHKIVITVVADISWRSSNMQTDAIKIYKNVPDVRWLITFRHIPIVQPTRYTCYLKLFILVKRSTCFDLSVHHQELKTAHTATVYVKQLLLPAAMGDGMELVASISSPIAVGCIRTRNTSKRAGADPCLRPRGRWDRLVAMLG
jgi:hypothetical protein